MKLYRNPTSRSLVHYDPKQHGYDYVGDTLYYVEHEDHFVIVIDPDVAHRAVLYNEKDGGYYPAIEVFPHNIKDATGEIAKCWETHTIGKSSETFDGQCRCFDIVYIMEPGTPSLHDWRVEAEGIRESDLAEYHGVITLARYKSSDMAHKVMKRI